LRHVVDHERVQVHQAAPSRVQVGEIPFPSHLHDRRSIYSMRPRHSEVVVMINRSCGHGSSLSLKLLMHRPPSTATPRNMARAECAKTAPARFVWPLGNWAFVKPTHERRASLGVRNIWSGRNNRSCRT
jgi:hypothetical protein